MNDAVIFDMDGVLVDSGAEAAIADFEGLEWSRIARR